MSRWDPAGRGLAVGAGWGAAGHGRPCAGSPEGSPGPQEPGGVCAAGYLPAERHLFKISSTAKTVVGWKNVESGKASDKTSRVPHVGQRDEGSQTTRGRQNP